MERTMKNIINNSLVPFLKEYFKIIYDGKENLIIDGVSAYNDKAQFVGGKVINACCYAAVNSEKESGEYGDLLQKLKEIIDFEATLPMKTWGALNCITGLYRLSLNGILRQAVSDNTMEILKREVDWRKFVDINNNLALIDLPTNYYGVAFGIAKYRELLGWDKEGFSSILLNKLLEHIDLYSGSLSYMDETSGEGRFDRYSILIPGELTALLTATDTEIPEKLLVMLRKSADIFLAIANDKGHGFTYGRSIGAYGDTSALEVLSMAAYLDVLSEEEKQLAYAYSTRIMNKYVSFWLDDEMKSLNMWEKGRRTDGYRNKNRILGENLSLSMQIINTYEHWTKAGFEEVETAPDFKERLQRLPQYSLFRFSQDEYDRAMVVIRDGDHVFSLPLISGGKPYYNRTPYLPIPNESMVLESGADTVHPNLVPKFTMYDDTEVMPIVYMKSIEEASTESGYEISYQQDELCCINGGAPEKYQSLKSKTSYHFEHGCIMREDIFIADGEINVKELLMEFATFSEEPELKDNKVAFGKGDIYEIEAQGFEECQLEIVEDNQLYNTSHGALKYKILWRSSCIDLSKPLVLNWVIRYK